MDTLLKCLNHAELIPGSGLDDVDILSSHWLLNLNNGLAIGFVVNGTAAQTDLQMSASNNFNLSSRVLFLYFVAVYRTIGTVYRNKRPMAGPNVVHRSF